MSDALIERLQRDEVTRLWVIYHDYSGTSHAKIVPPERFHNALTSGVGFAKANMDFNILDHQVEAPVFGADTGDFYAVPDPETYTLLPYAPRHARTYSFLNTSDNERWSGCPRSALWQVVQSYTALGLTVRAAFEPECTFFERAGDSWVPADRSRMFSVDGLDSHLNLLDELMATLGAMGITLEQVGAEYGPAQYEINLKHASPMQAADDLLTLKDVLRALARRAGLLASFMPKPFGHMPGCGLHVHIGLEGADGVNILQGAGPVGLSDTGRAFVGGLLAHAAGLCGVGSPTVNSYKRLLPGSWAPAHVCYGSGNRAALVRIPQGDSVHVEFRAGDNSTNPYLFLTALLAAGLDGLERHLDPGDPIQGDIGHWSEEQVAAREIARLPQSVGPALDALQADAVLMDALGPVIGPTLLRVKRSELEAYDLEVTDWERAAYLETI